MILIKDFKKSYVSNQLCHFENYELQNEILTNLPNYPKVASHPNDNLIKQNLRITADSPSFGVSVIS